MNDIPPFLPERASTLADRFELLFWYITLVSAIAGLLVYAFMFYCCVKYRRGVSPGSTPRILGSHRLELAWTVLPLLIFLTFFAGGVLVYSYASHPPADSMEVFVIGKQWMWKAQYPNGQRVIIGGNPRNMTAEERGSIGAMLLPMNRNTKVTLISEDVIHDFGVPAFRSKIDVLPGRYTQAWYHPTKIGEYHIYCDQYCGTWHSLMVGKIKVVEGNEFDSWLAGHNADQSPDTKNPVDGSLAEKGKQQFLRLQCLGCHNTGSSAAAPLLEGIYNQPRRVRIRQADGTYSDKIEEVIADDAYILESVIDPRAKVREGWKEIMPGNYHGQTTPEDLNALTQYIRSLKPGSLPTKTERQPPQIGVSTVSPQPPKSPEKK